jgi:protein-histidine N-methyltransferase
MAEDSAGHDNEELIAGIEKGDIKPNFYEGGFKTWECALDLAKLSLDEDILNETPNSPTDIHIIEVRAWSVSMTFTGELLTYIYSSAQAQQFQH